jgi:hypothetical protein
MFAPTSRVARRRLYPLLAGLCLLLFMAALSGLQGCGEKTIDASSVQQMRMERTSAPAGMAYQSQGGGMGRGGGMGGGRAQMGAAPAMAPETAANRAGSSGQTGNWPTTPMLIRTANVLLRVEDVPRAHAEIGRIAQEAGGYVATSTLSAESGPAAATITIRLPNEGLDSAIDRIVTLGKLLSKNITSEEVTQEFVDLTSRRRNLEREEQRLLDLLQRAGRVRELLEVEQEVGRVRGEIETITGRLRYLANRVSLSTITVQLQGPQPTPTTGGPVWTARDVGRGALRSLIDTGRALATIGIWLGVYLPVWLPITLITVWIGRRNAKRASK